MPERAGLPAGCDPVKEGRALRTEATLNQPHFGIGEELTNLAAMAEVGYAANRRLLDAECISHDPADGAAALEAITSPVISTTCTRIPGMRFPTRASRPSWRRHVPALGFDAESPIPIPADGSKIWGDGSEVETLIKFRIAQAGLDVTEVASYEHPRIHSVSNLNAASDG